MGVALGGLILTSDLLIQEVNVKKKATNQRMKPKAVTVVLLE